MKPFSGPMTTLPFNRPYATGNEHAYIEEAIANLHVSGNGPFSERCTDWLRTQTGCERALLTTSCTAALELAVLLADIGPGDEVVMPSFTFVSTANAVALRGGTPVFVDIRKDTLNIDTDAAAGAVTERTRAVMPVHYAGVGCDMDAIGDIAARHDLTVIEDAAQAVMSTYRGRPLGSLGDLGCLSFHETKNVICGEGGALLINRADWIERAEILHEKGTNRSQFFRGQVDKYTWVDLGSSFLASDLSAAFLWAQLEAAADLTRRRLAIWRLYHESFADLEEQGRLRRPVIPDDRSHNAHMYYLLLEGYQQRSAVIAHLAKSGIMAVFHYVPLHSAPAGERFGHSAGALPVTDAVSDSLIRLPLWIGMGEHEVNRVRMAVGEALDARP